MYNSIEFEEFLTYFNHQRKVIQQCFYAYKKNSQTIALNREEALENHCPRTLVSENSFPGLLLYLKTIILMCFPIRQ